MFPTLSQRGKGHQGLLHQGDQWAGDNETSFFLVFPVTAVKGFLCTQHHSLSLYLTQDRARAVQGLGFSALLYSFLHFSDLAGSLLHLPQFGRMLSKHFAVLFKVCLAL